MGEQIIWPQTKHSNSELISFAVLCDGEGIDDNEWLDKCIENALNIKYVSLLKATASNESKMKCNHNAVIERYDDNCKDNQDCKCIVLKESELKSRNIFENIMSFAFR